MYDNESFLLFLIIKTFPIDCKVFLLGTLKETGYL